MTGRIQTFLDQLDRDQLLVRLELALEGASLGIWDWDLRDNSVQFDRRWCEMLGLDHASTPMHLSTWESRVHPDDLGACYQDVQAHLDGRTTRYENVHRIRHSSGEWLYILDRGRISGRDEEGRPIRFTGTHFDVTETERARRVLQDQERQLKQLVAQVPSAVAVLDRDMRYLATSGRWVSDNRLEPEGLIGRSHYDVFPAVTPRWRDIYARALAGESFMGTDERFERDNGEVYWLRWDVRPWRGPHGEVNGVMLMTEDTTALVLARAARETEARLASLGVVAAGIAHEISTPLQVIALESGVIDQELSSEQPDLDEVRDSAATIGATAARAGALVQAVRTLSRDSGDDPETVVSVAELLGDARALCVDRFAGGGVALEVAEVPLDLAVRARRPEVVHILVNLLQNAFDAVRAGGTPRILLGCAWTSSGVLLRCEDWGPGIPAELQPRVFEPFFTTKPVGQGTGLGLSVSHALAHRNGGVLRLVSDEPHTTFELTLKREPSGAAA